jgi:phosphate transport system protein
VSKHMHRDLERLQRSVLNMASLVEEAIIQSIQSLQEFDADRAKRVIESDSEIDLAENQVQNECLKILALHQPVAVDLRRVSAVLMLVTDLERMGDLAVGIAERSLEVSRPPFPQVPERIHKMALRTATMVRDSLNAFVQLDANAARSIIQQDDLVDADNNAIIVELITRMKQKPEELEPSLSLFSAVRNLERIADHATNIAEEVIYLVEGEMARHHPEMVQRRRK